MLEEPVIKTSNISIIIYVYLYTPGPNFFKPGPNMTFSKQIFCKPTQSHGLQLHHGHKNPDIGERRHCEVFFRNL